MDFEKARFLMVEQQIRTWEVLDSAVLDLLFAVKREDFVPPAYRSLAFVDMEIPLGHGQVMMVPKLEARIVQEVAAKAGNSVLEIGAGSGYLAALLAKQAAHVTALEYFDDLSRVAVARLAQANIANVLVKCGDAAKNLAGLIGNDARFDVIVLSASVPVLPPALLNHLEVGGRLFAVVGDAPAMKATVFTKTVDNTFLSDEIFETVLAPLINATQPSRFTF